MKNILLADNRPDLLATLEPILKHWGYRVLTTSKTSQIATFLAESDPALLVIGQELYSQRNVFLNQQAAERLSSGDLPLIVLKQGEAAKPELPAGEVLDVPMELFELFAFIQSKVENHPRHNLRLRLRLPGMYSIEEDEFILADVLSLSIRGLFFKAAARLKRGDRITVVFPLLGHRKELEVRATVCYVIRPETRNNYFQGFGVTFDDLPSDQSDNLQLYIKECFLKEVSSNVNGVSSFAENQLKI